MIMDQITYSRDRPIFIRNFPRWREAASRSIHTICQPGKLP